MNRDRSSNNNTENIEIEPTISQVSSNQEFSANEGLLGILLLAAFTVAGFRLIYLKSGLHLDKFRPIKPSIFKRLTQPNCKKCRFYSRTLDSSFNGDSPRNGLSRNSHLHCAVHPVRVNFAEAENCPDYWQRDRRKFLYR